MKKRTNVMLRVQIGMDLSLIEKIEFAFSQCQNSTPLRLVDYPSDSVVSLNDNTLGIIFTRQDTEQFQEDSDFYMDTRITLKDSVYNPQTPITTLYMHGTLFEEVPESHGNS